MKQILKHTETTSEAKCSSTRSAKNMNENWFRTPKASCRTLTLQSESKQPFTISFKDEFQKINSRMGSFVTETSEFKSTTDKIYEQQVQELKHLDIINQNVSLQQENLMYKQQVQMHKEQLNHKEKVIKKLNLTIQQLSQYNEQLKNQYEKTNKNDELPKHLKQQIKLLQEELDEKNNRIIQFSKIEDEIKQVEEFYIKLLSKLKSELIQQNRDLFKLNNHMQCLSQCALLRIDQEEIPIDIVFKFKQYGLFEDDQQINTKADVFEISKQNGIVMQKILDNVKDTFDKVSFRVVEGFQHLIK